MQKREIKAYSYGSLINIFSNSLFKAEHVFRTTAYLRNLADNSLVLISSHKWRSPFTVNIAEETIEGKIVPGEVMVFRDGRIEGNNTVIELRGAEPYEQRIPIFNGERGLSVEEISRLVAFFKVLSTAWEGVLGSAVVEKLCNYRDNLIEKDFFREVVGAGGGFTPSGDDFLVGLLSSNELAKRIPRLKPLSIEIDEYILGRTTWASSQYIKYASRGIYDELVLENAVAIFAGEYYKSEDLFFMLARRGHESGLYIWLGLITGFSLIKYNRSLPLEIICR